MNPTEDHFCTVCGTPARGGSWMCHLRFKGRRVVLCSPQCIAAFKLDPEVYLGQPNPSVEIERADALPIPTCSYDI